MRLRHSIQFEAAPEKPTAGVAVVPCRGKRDAFTLLELLVVLAIIGLLAAISLPALKGMQRSNVVASASRQLVDDLAFARQFAIKERTTVHVLFVPPDIALMTPNPSSPIDRRQWTNLLTGPFTRYGIYAERSVGDQPGQAHPRYLGQWRTLPDGVFIAPAEFQDLVGALWDNAPSVSRPFKYSDFPFPTVRGTLQRVPHLTFDPKGSLLVTRSNGARVIDDELIYLARGSILYQRDASGQVVDFDVRESPPGSSTNTVWIRIDGLTGRAKVEKPEITD